MDVHCCFPSIYCQLVIIAVVFYLCPCPSVALQYTVGDSVWSIPLTYDFYNNWSSSHSFHVGDSLRFEFESELHNVLQVSIREYESCTANSPFKAFTSGPAIVSLMENGVLYFICSVSNYCALGQKLTVIVNESSPPSAVSAASTHSLSDSLKSPPSPIRSSNTQSSGGEFASNGVLKVVLVLHFGMW